MNVVVDTCCFVSFFMKDGKYPQSLALLEKIASKQIEGIISAITFVELCGVLKRNVSEQDTQAARQKILRLISGGFLQVIPLTISDAERASDVAITTGLKGADAIIVEAAKRTNASLFTFDDELKKKARGLVTFYERA